jgi:hypothetical protein
MPTATTASIDQVKAFHRKASISTRVRTSSHTVFFGDVLFAAASSAAPLIYADAQFFDGATLQPAIEAIL